MKVMAFNGSPRKKKWNTVTLLKSALEGAASVGAETELVQLYRSGAGKLDTPLSGKSATK